MARVPITVLGYKCERCGHEWIPRGDVERDPRVCPKCKSPYWNKPRKVAPMTYEEFRDRVRSVLESTGHGVTWTQIRTAAKLPQMYPNNRWVRRMEDDIGLLRSRDHASIIHWQLGQSGEMLGALHGTATADGPAEDSGG
jgi:DNA-directed RNA polymerase subunit RPC12/RpoP